MLGFLRDLSNLELSLPLVSIWTLKGNKCWYNNVTQLIFHSSKSPSHEVCKSCLPFISLINAIKETSQGGWLGPENDQFWISCQFEELFHQLLPISKNKHTYLPRLSFLSTPFPNWDKLIKKQAIILIQQCVYIGCSGKDRTDRTEKKKCK